jgi:hypothetical protein
MKNTINIFSETGCIQHEVLWKYRQGTLTASEKHAVEVHLTDCELCSDALAGMMIMESDEMMAGLRKSVRNISSPKKVIRFYDYRVLTAAAAVIAVVFVFAYVINSSEKSDKKQIAQLIVPQEPKKDEKPATINPDQKSLENTSTLSANVKQSENNKEKANVTYNWSSSNATVTANNATPSNSNVDKQEETTVAKDITTNDAEAAPELEYTAPAQTQSTSGASSRYERYEEKAAAPALAKSEKKKSVNDDTSQILYMNDLKVSRTPAMTETEKFDTVRTGTSAMYENAQSASGPLAREMPFVYSKTLRDGMNYFHNKQYEYASQMFSIILERLPNDVNSQFYKGISEMELHNYALSSDLLNKAMLNSDKTFYEEARFKLALCYIALGKKEDAEKLLGEIIAEKGFYSKQASEELQRLE